MGDTEIAVGAPPDPAKASPSRIVLTTHAQRRWTERALAHVDEPPELFCSAALRVGHRIDEGHHTETEEIRVYRDFQLVFEPAGGGEFDWALVTVLPKGDRGGNAR